jgi:L-amino acid N-acyltransferase YncA
VANIRVAGFEDAESIAEIHVTAWRESYEGIVPRPVLDALSIPDKTERWRRILAEKPLQQTYVAEQEGRLVGFAGGGKCRSDELGQGMEIYAIYLLSEVKRQGIGGRLLRTLVNTFLLQGTTSAGAWVLEDNHPARRFYESLGAQLATEKVSHRAGYDLIVVGYIWTDLRRSFSN